MAAYKTQVGKFERFGFVTLLLLCLLLVNGRTKAADAQYDPSPLTSGLGVVVDLRGIWLDENGYRHVVPFNLFDRDEMEISCRFDLPGYDRLQDTLYLYLEAVAWTSEIFLNDKLLAVTEDPFEEHLFALKKEWLKPTDNHLLLHLSTAGLTFPWYPERFIGVFRQTLILQADSLPVSVHFPETVNSAKRAALIAAWTPDQQYLNDTMIIDRLASGLFAYPFPDPLAFPFRLSNRSQAILARLGLKVLPNVQAADSLAIYNYYPYASKADHKSLKFWRDSKLRPTSNYGKFQSQHSISSPDLNPPDRVSLLIFLLVPVLCMISLKLIAPRAYGSLGEYVTKTKIYLELIADNKFLKIEQRWLMNLLRMIVTSVTVALFLYYVELSETWSILNLFTTRSIVYSTLSSASQPLWQLFLEAFVLVATLNLLKYFIFNSIGTVFRVFNLSASIQNLDVFAAFPLNLIPYLPASFIFFLDPAPGAIVLRIWGILFLLYGARRIWLLYSGIGRLYQISGSLKILYICTLEILPCLILI
ncbi:MAG: hypothetical protein RLZZ519_370 [Bacteroidota bacterium]|jgi:hypothetical protein